jgi:hypothetical protein
MRPRRTNRDSVRSNEVRRCWLARWATKSIVTSTSRTRSSMLLIWGSWGCLPRPGHPKNTLPHSSGKSFATGCQNSGEPPAPGKNKILRISTPSPQVERILYPLVQRSAIGAFRIWRDAGFESVMNSEADVHQALQFKLIFVVRSTADRWWRSYGDDGRFSPDRTDHGPLSGSKTDIAEWAPSTKLRQWIFLIFSSKAANRRAPRTPAVA